MTSIKTSGNQQDEMQFFPQEFEILTLFPIRKSQVNIMNQLALNKLLTCRLCSSLLQDAVYLKCSHRFCKKCIEKHIRSSVKKVCPTCKMPVLTKRQLKPDPFFGDFTNTIPICPKISSNDFKIQDDYPQTLKQEYSPMKMNQVKKRKRPQSLNISEIEKSSMSKKVKTATPYHSIESQGLQQSFSFYVNSSSQIEIQQKEENDQIAFVKIQNSLNKKQKNEEMKSKLEENLFTCQQNCQQIPFTDPSYDIKIGNSFQFIDTINQTNQQQLNVKQASIQTNNKFLLDPYYTNIRLKNHPHHFFTPKLPFQEISCATKTCLSDIASLIGSFFNISRHHIRLFSTRKGLRNQLPFYATVKKIFGSSQTVENESHSLGDRIELVMLIEQLGTLQIKQQYLNSQRSKEDQIIYFAVSPTKINPKRRYKH